MEDISGFITLISIRVNSLANCLQELSLICIFYFAAYLLELPTIDVIKLPDDFLLWLFLMV